MLVFCKQRECELWTELNVFLAISNRKTMHKKASDAVRHDLAHILTFVNKPQHYLRVQLFFATMICCTLHTSPSTDRPVAPDHPPPSQGCQPTSPVTHHHRLTFRCSSFQPTSGWKFLQARFEENIFSTKLLREVSERLRSSKLNCLNRGTFRFVNRFMIDTY